MAEVIGIVASAITIGASAAQLSLALFSVAQTLKNAPKQIAEIAEEFSIVSESLQTLADVLRAHQDLCKPALYKNTHAIILRYKQVDAEMKKLIDTPQKLAGLQWFINKPKAKGLLKKIEGIKTALILELNIIRLAREEFNRPYSNMDSSVLPEYRPRFNRFRKIVESAVQANRKVVEHAQQDDDKLWTGSRRYTNAELDIWKEGSFDTATWLYHLVFSPDVLSEEHRDRRRLHQASVADELSSSDDNTTISHKRDTKSHENSMIVWSQQTEPSSVVDRLLSSWTTLSSDQITNSAANQDGDEWREGMLKKIEEAKKEADLSFDQWEQQNEPVKIDDETFGNVEDDNLSDITLPTYNFFSNTKNHRKRGIQKSTDSDPWAYRSRQSPTLSEAKTTTATIDSPVDHDSGEKRSSRRRVRWMEDPLPTEPSRSPPSRQDNQTTQSRRALVDDSPPPRIRVTRFEDSPYPEITIERVTRPSEERHNPFAPKRDPQSAMSGYPPSWQDPSGEWHFQHPYRRPSDGSYPPASVLWPNPPPDDLPHYKSTFPPPPPPPQPYIPPQSKDSYYTPPHVSQKESPRESEMAAKEKAIIAAIEKLLEKRGQDEQFDSSDPRFLKLVQMLTAQQEREAQNERERANAATEAQIKLMQAAHDKDNERLRHLESLAAEQKQEQIRQQAVWKEERIAMDEKAAKQAQEARDMAMREIAAVQSARAEAERQTQERADARAAEERKRIESRYKKQLKRYEDLLRGFQEQQVKPEQDAQHPIRRTRIAEGNRSVDVIEYSTSKSNSFYSSSSSLRSLQHGFAQFELGGKQPGVQAQYPRHSRRDSFRSSAASLHSSHASIGTVNTSNTTETSQQLIVFPAKADRASQRLTELRTSLAALGIESTFEDPEGEDLSQLVPYSHDDPGEQMVRSTLFWEASMLSLGSELLLTMRQAGWRPAYTRTSAKGQTHYLGNQPVHAYFFTPDYKPQFCPAIDSSTKESITIQKSLVEEYALIELGFEYQAKDSGIYVLDGRLTYGDIESLVERSFLMRENNYRRLHRQLQWHFDKSPAAAAPSAPFPRTYTPSLHSVSSVYTGDDNSTACGDSDTDTECKENSAVFTVDRSEVGSINGRDRVSARSRDEGSVKSSSATSSASKSTNPFRAHMLQTKQEGHTAKPGFLGGSIWDDPAVASLI